MKKAGPPDVGVPRRVTSGEARLLGCPHTWWIRLNADSGVSLLKPEKGILWVVTFTESNRRRLNELTHGYWKRDENERGIYVRRDVLLRIGDAARAALVHGMLPPVVRSELEWVAASLGR